MRAFDRRSRPFLLALYRALRDHFGHAGWWPGETPFEVMVGAVLTQNTAWTNVERAIANLKAAGVLEPRPLLSLSRPELSRLIRPAGYFNVKAERLASLLDWFGGYDFDLDRLRKVPLRRLRSELLAVRGVGPETADSILLYALGRRTFVIDAYTRRIAARVGIETVRPEYDTLRDLFMRQLPRSKPLYNDCHAQFVNLGKHFCRPRPRCEECPVRRMCAEGGGRLPEPVTETDPGDDRRRSGAGGGG